MRRGKYEIDSPNKRTSMREMIEIFKNQKERLEFQTHQGFK